MTTRLIRISTGTNHEGLRLEITDDLSGEVLAEVKLTTEQTWSVISGGSITVDAKSTSHPDRVGKKMVNDSVAVPQSLITAIGYGATGEMRCEVGEQWARENLPGWDTYAGRVTNRGGVRVVLRKWVTA